MTMTIPNSEIRLIVYGYFKGIENLPQGVHIKIADGKDKARKFILTKADVYDYYIIFYAHYIFSET